MGDRFLSMLAGFIFGIGLAISGMYDPARVLGFLDVAGLTTGVWDPSLAFVLAGALLVAVPGFAWARARGKPLAASGFQQPGKAGLERNLILGSALFGIGWGLVGYCPGPALAAMGFGQPDNFLFVAAMIIGMAVHRLTLGRQT